MVRHALLRVAAIVCVVGAAGCLTPSEPGEPLTCLPPGVTTDNWQSITQAPVTYKVPPTYVRPAGSRRWESGRTWVDIQFILPGAVNTDPPEVLVNSTACRASVRGRTLVIQLGQTSAAGQFGSGWYMGANWGRIMVPGQDGIPQTATLAVEAWTQSQILIEELLAVIWSLVVGGAGGT